MACRGGARGACEPRRDPIAELAAQNKSRIPSLVPVRRERMSESPFAFYRGAAAVMAADLAGTATTGVLIQICGDAHLSNFGLFASRERALLFDVNDFDETAVGPWEWDVKRLVTSMAILGHDFGMSDDDVRQTATKTAAAYRTRINELAQMSALERFYLKTTALEVLDLVSRLSKSALQIGHRDGLEGLQEHFASGVTQAHHHHCRRSLPNRGAAGHRGPRPGDWPVRGGRDGRRVLRLGARGCGRPAGLSPVPGRRGAGGRCRQRGHALLSGAAHRCRRFAVVPADEGGVRVGRRGVFPQELRWEHGRRVVAGQRIMQASGDPSSGT